MPFTVKKGKKKMLLVLNGNVDISEARDLADLLKGAKSDIEVGMKDLSYMDCSTLQLLLAASAACEKNSANLRVTERSEEADRVIKLAGAADAV